MAQTPSRPKATSQDLKAEQRDQEKRTGQPHRYRAVISFPKEEVQRIVLQRSKSYLAAVEHQWCVCRDSRSRRTLG